ncbi:MAG: AbrB/MazE/SpoVT family DNA-binding domain-containing protein [Chloroflexota bacterium]
MTTVNTYPIKLRERGQLTIPQAVREQLATKNGDMLTLVQFDDFVVLAPANLKTPALSNKLAQMMEDEGMTLSELLKGLEDERQKSYEMRLEKLSQQNDD